MSVVLAVVAVVEGTLVQPVSCQTRADEQTVTPSEYNTRQKKRFSMEIPTMGPAGRKKTFNSVPQSN